METFLRRFSTLLLIITFGVPSITANSVRYIYGTSITGVTEQLDVARTPALFTGDFGNCPGRANKLFNITKFDAAYYTDNATVLFHLDGQSSIANESLIMHFSMDAYGQNRFTKTFNPCKVNIYSLCPLQAAVPVTAWAVFPVGAQQVGDIPSIAFNVPDFEGSFTLQIFGNSTQKEIGCFQASLSNGNTMSHPKVISPILALFVLAAVSASFATATYGASITAMRTHYAHSLSAMVIFETFQSIFFSGALQLDFPSVLSAWWSNFAWAAGQIYSRSIIDTAGISSGTGGGVRQIGDANSLRQAIALAKQIYATSSPVARKTYGRTMLSTTEATHQLWHTYKESDPYDYSWAGNPVNPGVATPGTWTGFPGTLGVLDIPAADAFSVGSIWLLVLMAILIFALFVLKLLLEALVKMKWIKEDRLAYFRSNWFPFTIIAVLRTLFAAFSMIMTLSFYQMSFDGSRGTKALASIFFLIFFMGFTGWSTYACYVRLKAGTFTMQTDRILFIRRKKLNCFPYIFSTRRSTLEKAGLSENSVGSLPWFQLQYHNDPNRVPVHHDEPYIKSFGWLSARYRRTRWWFFTFYLAYQLFRAAIVGGGLSTPKAQVCSLLVYDILAFFVILKIDPFEGRRNTALAVWMLGISKILTTALSVAFLPELKANRILTTALGIIIIVIQGLLTIGVMILVVLSVISSYMSVTRDRDHIHPKLDGIRTDYLAHLNDTSKDIRTSRAETSRLKKLEKEAALNAKTPEPTFNVHSVQRITKIYDEDEHTPQSLYLHHLQTNSPAGSRPASIRSTSSNLPRAARAVIPSWSPQDFGEWPAQASSTWLPGVGQGTRLSELGRSSAVPSWTSQDFGEWNAQAPAGSWLPGVTTPQQQQQQRPDMGPWKRLGSYGAPSKRYSSAPTLDSFQENEGLEEEMPPPPPPPAAAARMPTLVSEDDGRREATVRVQEVGEKNIFSPSSAEADQ